MIIQKHKNKFIIFGLICIEIFLIYLLDWVNKDQSHDLSMNEFTENAAVIQNLDKVGANVSLKEAIHGLDGITYRYIVKTDCPNRNFETRYVTDEPLEWAGPTGSAEVIIYDIQVRYNGTIYANGTYYIVPILNNIASENISLDEWKQNLIKQGYQTYISKTQKIIHIMILKICLICIPIIIIVYIQYIKRKKA